MIASWDCRRWMCCWWDWLNWGRIICWRLFKHHIIELIGDYLARPNHHLYTFWFVNTITTTKLHFGWSIINTIIIIFKLLITYLQQQLLLFYSCFVSDLRLSSNILGKKLILPLILTILQLCPQNLFMELF